MSQSFKDEPNPYESASEIVRAELVEAKQLRRRPPIRYGWYVVGMILTGVVLYELTGRSDDAPLAGFLAIAFVIALVAEIINALRR